MDTLQVSQFISQRVAEEENYKDNTTMKIIWRTLFQTWVFCVCLREMNTTFTTTPKWMWPCGPPQTTLTSDTSSKSISLKTSYNGLYENAVEFYNAVSKLESKYIPPRITGGTLISLLNSVELPGLNLSKDKFNVENITQDFLTDYEDLSRLAVFLEQVSADEKYYDFAEYSSVIEPVEDALYLHLCNLQIVIRGVNSTVSHYVMRDVMNASLRNLSKRTDRYMRDYVIFHTAKNFGKYLEDKYKYLYTILPDIGN